MQDTPTPEALIERIKTARGGREEHIFSWLAWRHTALMDAIDRYHTAAFGYEPQDPNAAIDRKTRELIGVAVLAAQRDWERFPIHLRHVLDLGATDAEVVESLAVASVYGGSPTLRTGVSHLLQLRADDGVDVSAKPSPE